MQYPPPHPLRSARHAGPARPATGFTMIELVMVIVLLGVLAAIAMPRLVDLRSEAVDTVTLGVARSARSAMQINNAVCASLNHVVTPGRCVRVDDCEDAWLLLNPGNPDAAKWDIVAAPIAGNATTIDCSVRHNPNGIALAAGRVTAIFQGIGAGQ